MNDEAERERLLDAAEVALLALGPRATMHDLAAEASATKPILYRHFTDKAGLFRAVLDRWADHLGTVLAIVVDRESHEKSVAALTDFFGSFDAKRQLLALANDESGLHRLFSATLADVEQDVVRQLLRRLDDQADPRTEILTVTLVAGLFGAAHHRLVTGTNRSANEDATAIVAHYCSG